MAATDNAKAFVHCRLLRLDRREGASENEDIRISELECPVSTDPVEISRSLDGEGPTRVVFCTYHSLGRITEAQALHDAPEFDLAIADEAHRTTGALLDGRGSNDAKKIDFQEFHDAERLRARKRLYMTATPRLYTERSRSKLAEQGIGVVDMGDYQRLRTGVSPATVRQGGATRNTFRLPRDRARSEPRERHPRPASASGRARQLE